METSIFQSCTQDFDDGDNIRDGVTITFIHHKNLDAAPFAQLQAISSLSGIKFGDYPLDPASKVLFIDGGKRSSELQHDIKQFHDEFDLSNVLLLSMKSYNSSMKVSSTDPDIPVTHSSIVDKIEKLAQKEDLLCVIFHDLQSLTGSGSLCKPAEFQDLHNRLKAQGVLQIYFVNTEAEATQIAVKPDLIFNIAKVNDAALPTIKLTSCSAPARVQDSFLPVELELHFNKDNTWHVEESIRRQDLDAAIKALALMGKTRKQIAETLGNTCASTVGRRLHDMQDRGEIILKGHRVIRA